MTRTVAVGCPRWTIVAADLPPDSPAAVFHANRAVAVSSEAVGFGVRKGMRRRDAQARCPELEVIPHDPARDARAFEPIVCVVESFTPKVEVVRPGLCVLPARGPSRYFGGEDQLREQLASAVDEAIAAGRTYPLHPDDRCRVGVADGPFAATLAATRGVVVGPKGSGDFLSSFGVGVLEAPKLTDLLMRLGIRTLGDLAALPAGKVTARFGAEGQRAHRLARGEDRLLEPRTPPPDLIVRRELDPPANRVDVAMFAGKAAANELSERLTDLGLQCAKIEISVETEHGEEHTRTWRYSSSFTSTAIAERVRWQLEGWLAATSRISGGISVVRLAPQDAGPATGETAHFWSRRTEPGDRVRRAIARIQGLLGPHGAQQNVLQGGRHPSEQVLATSWGDPLDPIRPGLPGEATARGPVEVELPPWPGRLPQPSPALMKSHPSEVTDESGNPVTVNGRSLVSAPPSRVRLPVGWRQIKAWAGPWPTDERWWASAKRRRTARFQIVCDDDSAHLLVLQSGQWILEATYD